MDEFHGRWTPSDNAYRLHIKGCRFCTRWGTVLANDAVTAVQVLVERWPAATIERWVLCGTCLSQQRRELVRYQASVRRPHHTREISTPQ